MTLLTVTSLEELVCLASLTAGVFWTSGSSEGLNCDLEKKYAWCSTGFNASMTLTSSPDFWLSTNATPSSTLDRCLALVNSANSKNQGMEHRNCEDALPYICQYHVDCPDQCSKNMTWMDSYRHCCALGMETLNIDNEAEQRGLTNMTVALKANWKANFNYWTSGTRNGAQKGQWSWCEPNGPTVFSAKLKWEAGQPDNSGGSESCVHFRFVLNATGAIMTDRNCTSKYIFACKVTFHLKDFFSYGDWYDGCGRNFLTFSKEPSNWTHAWNWCCKIGLTLASMESTGKSICFSKIVSKFAPAIFGDYWLAGTDLRCDSNFRWCSRSQDFVEPELKWKAGHPLKGSNCVYLEVRNGSVLLASADCAEKKDFLCEVRRKNTFGKAMQTECAEIWDITSNQIDLLLNVTAFLSTDISLNLKV
ncbi:uncharacterized protein LOC135943246 [Cloeon dipterum]|uniref:uncharacterized protein LOC135943246 n=1 Tax=Cloeon dipterum TaxID=197152 RepID=UPI00322066A8